MAKAKSPKGAASAEEHHEEVIAAVMKQFKPIFEHSTQPFFVYLDDTHKTCNEKFAAMLGYESAKTWSEFDVSFLDTFVDPGSQEAVMRNYHQGVATNLSASVLEVKWKKKNGETFMATMVQTPLVIDNHVLAFGFIIK